MFQLKLINLEEKYHSSNRKETLLGAWSLKYSICTEVYLPFVKTASQIKIIQSTGCFSSCAVHHKKSWYVGELYFLSVGD